MSWKTVFLLPSWSGGRSNCAEPWLGSGVGVGVGVGVGASRYDGTS